MARTIIIWLRSIFTLGRTHSGAVNARGACGRRCVIVLNSCLDCFIWCVLIIARRGYFCFACRKCESTRITKPKITTINSSSSEMAGLFDENSFRTFRSFILHSLILQLAIKCRQRQTLSALVICGVKFSRTTKRHNFYYIFLQYNWVKTV